MARGLDAADVVMVEGAKRDRNSWPADMSVSLRSALVSQNVENLKALKKLLVAVMVLQDPVSGYFPYAGSPFGDFFVEYGDLGKPFPSLSSFFYITKDAEKEKPQPALKLGAPTPTTSGQSSTPSTTS